MDAKSFLVPAHGRIRLADYATADTGGFERKDSGERKLEADIARLARIQEVLYAGGTYGVLIILQALDAAGKDGVIKHVMSGVNPQGCRVTSFKTPSAEELGHDYLWRCARALPPRGTIGIFNRSYYEEVLVARVHPEVLARQRLPGLPRGRKLWRQRFEDLNHFERYLTRNGYVILKFFLHLSREEQKRRFLKRIEDPEKHWKFSAADVRERDHWHSYRRAYEDLLAHTSTPWAPWYVIPADHKWFARLAVADLLVRRLRALKLKYPAPDPAQERELEQARRELATE